MIELTVIAFFPVGIHLVGLLKQRGPSRRDVAYREVGQAGLVSRTRPHVETPGDWESVTRAALIPCTPTLIRRRPLTEGHCVCPAREAEPTADDPTVFLPRARDSYAS